MDLNWKCNDEKEPLREKYIQLAIASAQNLGGASKLTVDQAIDWLKINASETDEDGDSEDEGFDWFISCFLISSLAFITCATLTGFFICANRIAA